MKYSWRSVIFAQSICYDVTLSSARDVVAHGGNFNATSDLPWLRIEFGAPLPVNRWIRLTFLASLLDPLCRPILRCVTDDGNKDAILPGALFGRGIWFGRIPRTTREILISPTNRPGLFGFSIEKLEIIPPASLVASCFRRDPKRCLVAMAARIAGFHFVADLQFYRVLSPTPLSDYAAWRRRHSRSLDVAGLEAPRFNWKSGPCFVFLVDPATQSLASVTESLNAQPYPNWRLIALERRARTTSDPAAPNPEKRGVVLANQSLSEIIAALPNEVLLLGLPLGGEIPPYALCAVAEAAARQADADIFYGDEDFAHTRDSGASVALKPDWSPRFWAQRHYLGKALFFRGRALRRLPPNTKIADLVDAKESLVDGLVEQGHEVSHIRRVLLTRPAAAERVAAAPRLLPMRSASGETRVSVILPTRDRLDLLEPCIKSLKATVFSPDLEVIIVDNGSVEPDTIRYLSGLTSDPRFRVLSYHASFNFSALCNRAAEKAAAPILLFLNNDCEFLAETRIDLMLSLAGKPDIGAVGAKLLYPNGSVQHAGVVLGTDGYAGHFERGLERDDAGYFSRLGVTHEVSGITAACLAIEKRKFDAIGGFDATHLPVDLNDIDLCLRLAERGWASVCASECVLVHRESQTRGSTLRPEALYRAEHEYIHARWINKLRDDPYFHPALSLDSLEARLG